MADDSLTIMKKAIDECKKQSIMLPEMPKNLLDPEIIAKTSGAEIHLAKRNNQILAVATENEKITNLILLDDSALVGIIGWTNRVWERIFERLPNFREHIDSEAKNNNESILENDKLLENEFVEAEREEKLWLSSLPTEEELQEVRRVDYEKGARWQINWDTSAWKLKRAADNLFGIYMDARSKAASKGNLRIFVEGGKGWDKYLDEQLIGIYYMLMGLAIENLFKGIIMVNHPEYVTSAGLEKIGKHETYEFLNESELKDLLSEFQKYKGILLDLAEYVKWKAKYPVSKSYKDFENVGDFIDLKLLTELYDTLSKPARRERRPEILRRQGIDISYSQFIGVQKEIVDFMKPSEVPNTITLRNIIDAYSQYPRELIISALEDYAQEVIVSERARRDLLLVTERWKLGWDDDSLGPT